MPQDELEHPVVYLEYWRNPRREGGESRMALDHPHRRLPLRLIRLSLAIHQLRPVKISPKKIQIKFSIPLNSSQKRQWLRIKGEIFQAK